MENSTIINGTQLIKDNMPVQPENIIIFIAVMAFIFLIVFGIVWAWGHMH
jgi:hypothetical protein